MTDIEKAQWALCSCMAVFFACVATATNIGENPPETVADWVKIGTYPLATCKGDV